MSQLDATPWMLGEVLTVERFFVGSYIAAMRELAGQSHGLMMLILDGDGDSRAHALAKLLTGPLDEFLSEPERYPLSSSLTFKIERLLLRLNDPEDLTTVVQIDVLFKELHNDILSELAEQYFFRVPASRRSLIDQGSLFGESVQMHFPEASPDIAAAGRCLAKDEWTAAVFHLMRVTELAQRKLATDLGIPDVQKQDWAAVTNRIEKKLREIEMKGRASHQGRNSADWMPLPL